MHDSALVCLSISVQPSSFTWTELSQAAFSQTVICFVLFKSLLNPALIPALRSGRGGHNMTERESGREREREIEDLDSS